MTEEKYYARLLKRRADAAEKYQLQTLEKDQVELVETTYQARSSANLSVALFIKNKGNQKPGWVVEFSTLLRNGACRRAWLSIQTDPNSPFLFDETLDHECAIVFTTLADAEKAIDWSRSKFGQPGGLQMPTAESSFPIVDGEVYRFRPYTI